LLFSIHSMEWNVLVVPLSGLLGWFVWTGIVRCGIDNGYGEKVDDDDDDDDATTVVVGLQVQALGQSSTQVKCTCMLGT
jgi:hypothetical protein